MPYLGRFRSKSVQKYQTMINSAECIAQKTLVDKFPVEFCSLLYLENLLTRGHLCDLVSAMQLNFGQ